MKRNHELPSLPVADQEAARKPSVRRECGVSERKGSWVSRLRRWLGGEPDPDSGDNLSAMPVDRSSKHRAVRRGGGATGSEGVGGREAGR